MISLEHIKNYLVQNYESPHNYYNENYKLVEVKKSKNSLNENGKEIKCLIKL